MIKGQRGGVCCPPNVNVIQLGCLCSRKRVYTKFKEINNFPTGNIFAPAHEIAHWYINRVVARMVENGDLKLPEFINSPEWKFQEPKGNICEGEETKQGRPFQTWLWNSLQQSTEKGITKIDRCKNHHYFIYSGQGLWGLTGHGPKQIEWKQRIQKNEPNLYNLYKEIWPCNNQYLSNCEDSAHGMTKGLAQTFIMGKSSSEDPAKMTCLDNVDKPEVEAADALSDLPTEDVVEEEEYAEFYQKKCKKVLKAGGWIEAARPLENLKPGEVASTLQYSDERAWWLRKCCAKTAKFV